MGKQLILLNILNREGCYAMKYMTLFKPKEYLPIDISMSELIYFIEKQTGISPIIIATVLDAEDIYLREKGVIID